MINSNQKGKRGEREWRDELRAQGYLKARRGQQFSGSPDSPDVVCPELEQFHFEVKHVERLNIWNAFLQAMADVGPHGLKTPIVAHKRNGSKWLVTMSAEAFFELVRNTEKINLTLPPNMTKAACKIAFQQVLDGNDPDFDILIKGKKI